METEHGGALVLCTPVLGPRSQVRLTRMSSHHDNDERVLAAGLFLALEMRRTLHFRTNTPQTVVSHPGHLMNG